MPNIYQSDRIASRDTPLNATGACDAVPVVAVAKTPAALVANDVFEMFVLPAGMVVHELKIAVDGLDTANGVALACGIMPGDPYDQTFANRTNANAIGQQFITGATIGRASAAGIQNINVPTWMDAQTPLDQDRSVGIQVTSAPTTNTAVGAKLRISAILRTVSNGY